jgi:eukaryotic-like serine/threonine-protein kinase
MTLAAGSLLGPYEILAPLGAGGMGEVYKARDTRLERTVAVKVLPPHLSSPEVRQRFEREAKTISQLSHAHICALYDVGREGNTEYLVMEFLEGETLADRLAKAPLPLEQTLRYGVEIADAWDMAHRQGIVHRDLKPTNVMITKSGVKLLDFGLAKAMAPSAPQSSLTALPTQQGLTQEGTILGTFQYMAPEQLEGKEADGRTDIFAFGAVLYEMATGRKAFAGSSQASLISAIMSSEPVPISTIQPMTPPALDRVAKTCLAKDPEDRWQSAGDVAKELRWIAEGSPASVTAPPTASRWVRSREAVAWTVAAVLLVVVALLATHRQKAGEIEWSIHSTLAPPENSDFYFTGDAAAPPMLSPDGRRIVFGASNKLWIRSLESGTETSLTGTDRASFPFWSPDSRFIGFFADAKLKTIEASGGPLQTLADAPDGRGGAWGPDGTIVFTPWTREPLYRVPASGGAPVPITHVDLSLHTTHRWPAFLPDGRHVIYLAANHNSLRSGQAGIYVASLDGKENRLLLRTFGSAECAPGWLLYVRENTLFAQSFDERKIAMRGDPVRVADRVHYDFGTWRGTFTVSRNGSLAYLAGAAQPGGQLTWFDRAGNVLGTSGERSDAFWPRLSPDGKRAALNFGDPSSDVWIQDLARGVRTRATRAAQIISEPVWSPDGSEIAYLGIPNQRDHELSVVRADGSAKPRSVLKTQDRVDPTDWSPDGRYLLCGRGPQGSDDIWVLPLSDPGKAFFVVQTPYLERGGRFSNDGRWIAYSSREPGRDEIYVTPFPAGGARVQVSTAGGTEPVWRRDGREIFFLSPDSRIMAAEVDGSGREFVVKGVQPLFRVNLFTGPRLSFHDYDVTADGQRFLVSSAGEARTQRLTFVVHWEAGLR